MSCASYGFDPSDEGVTAMLRAFQEFEEDPDVYVNSVAIQEALRQKKNSSPRRDSRLRQSEAHRIFQGSFKEPFS